jgi:hypothetical protein
MEDLGMSQGSISISEKKDRNLGNGRGKKKRRTEAVAFPKPRNEENSRFTSAATVAAVIHVMVVPARVWRYMFL